MCLPRRRVGFESGRRVGAFQFLPQFNDFPPYKPEGASNKYKTFDRTDAVQDCLSNQRYQINSGRVTEEGWIKPLTIWTRLGNLWEVGSMANIEENKQATRVTITLVLSVRSGLAPMPQNWRLWEGLSQLRSYGCLPCPRLQLY